MDYQNYDVRNMELIYGYNAENKQINHLNWQNYPVLIKQSMP